MLKEKIKTLLEKYPVILQFLKFGVVGAVNTAVDLGILYLLIWISGYDSGWQYTMFKAISFIVAVMNSYFLNKFWTFRSKEKEKMGIEFAQFIAVSLIGLGINVGAATIVVNVIHPMFGISPTIWAGVGALSGTAAGLLWNFIGYKLIVFKK